MGCEGRRGGNPPQEGAEDKRPVQHIQTALLAFSNELIQDSLIAITSDFESVLAQKSPEMMIPGGYLSQVPLCGEGGLCCSELDR